MRKVLAVAAVALVLVKIALIWAGRVNRPQEAAGGPVPIAAMKGKVGASRVTLTERSPLSADLAVLAERVGLVSARPVETGAAGPPSQPDLADYDLAKEEFHVRVPASAGADGTYGVMVGQCFKEYADPPTAWTAVLDKYHLIWIAAAGEGDDKPAARRIGLLLDAAHNAAKVWPVDHERVYLSMNTFANGAACGTAFYYPDVFAGQLQLAETPWYAKLDGFERPPLTWDTDVFPPPQAKDLALAESHGRFYLAERDGDAVATARHDIVLRNGYRQAGFKYVKAAAVPEAKMGHYADLTADWFEDGVRFLDAPLADLKAAKPAGR